MHLVLHQHQWERWLQTFFTIVLWISILFLEVAIFYAFSDLGLLWASIHSFLAQLGCRAVLLTLGAAAQVRELVLGEIAALTVNFTMVSGLH
jgi:hypothetical protein